MRQLSISLGLIALMGLGLISMASADNPPSTIQKVTDQAGQVVTDVANKAGEIGKQATEQAAQVMTNVADKAQDLKNQAEAKVGEMANAVENSEQAQQISAGLLSWIYKLAELLSFSAFYWLAFALMVAGVVSWTGQLVIAKFVLAVGSSSFDFRETISDAVVLAISLVGLVLTTQAAAQNSSFTHSTVAVLSSAAVGVVVGIVLYFWGQALEMEAASKK